MNRLEGKVVLITGAASGLGAAAAARLHREGAFVAVTDRNAAGAEATAAALGERAVARQLDVTDEAAWTAVVDGLVAERGRLDVLVNNAGIGIVGDIEEQTLEHFRLMHAVNTEGVFLGCKHAVRVMKPSGGGSIINVSSVAGIIAAPNLAGYASSKGAVRALTKAVAIHCAQKRYGIRCNSIHPAFIETPMVEAMVQITGDPGRARTGLARAIPLGKIGDPADVAAAVAYLASDDAAFVTGTELVVDGGLTAM